MYEPVYTLTHYYDGPRRGIAAYRGQPHLYESRFSDIGSESDDTFLLSPVSPDTFALALEDWAIWLRWETAFREGRTCQETHPALPEDAARRSELEVELASRLTIDESIASCATANFRDRPGSSTEAGASPELDVEWAACSGEGYADNRASRDFY
jgi:hypothetical protein